ncbi:hypothetical protein Tco_0906719 [Tanacetum coccineum]|uniref:Uncharacterized protein n=1 Tax=Tanacetum coccineum TaxID=301880 RepID=A0ABQ5CNF6_9ASTR
MICSCRKMPKFTQMVKLVVRNKEKLEEICYSHCPPMLNVPSHHEQSSRGNLKIRENFLSPCALQELNRTSALADYTELALIFYLILSTRNLSLKHLTPSRMKIELANSYQFLTRWE